MAKKSFKGGLDNLLASAGIKKKSEEKKVNEEKKEVQKEPSDDEKHWLLIKLDRLDKELKMWRTGEINVNDFHESLKKHNLKYNKENNEIEEI